MCRNIPFEGIDYEKKDTCSIVKIVEYLGICSTWGGFKICQDYICDTGGESYKAGYQFHGFPEIFLVNLFLNELSESFFVQKDVTRPRPFREIFFTQWLRILELLVVSI
jgi:hypothetical protein